MKKAIYLATALFVIAMCSAPLWAQINGTITGTAIDKDGKPIAGATVKVRDPSNGRTYQIKTNSAGHYSSIGINIGTYNLTLIINGVPTDEFDNVPISSEGERTVNFDLAKDKLLTAPAPAAKASEAENTKIKGLNATLAQAKQLEGAGNYDQAVTLLQPTAQANPTQDLLWAYLGDAQRGAASKATDSQARMKGYHDAIESYQKALAIKPNDGPYMGQLADAYARSNQTDKAVEQYAAAAQTDPQNAALYYYNEGVVFTNTGKSDEAVAALDKAIQLDPKRADAYYLKGQNLIAKATTKGDKMIAPAGTAEAFNKYLEMEPNGKFAEVAKQMLTAIGAPVETSFGKSKKK
jgi:tetratricopeptide (TPR) repeat protein